MRGAKMERHVMTTPDTNLPPQRPGPAHTSADDPAANNNAHLSETVKIEQWLRLLVVVSTLLLLLLTVAVAVRLLSAIGHTLLLFSLGGLLAYALDPLVEKIRGGRHERRARVRSVMAVFGLLLFAGILAVELLSSSLVHQVGLLSEDHTHYTQLRQIRETRPLKPEEQVVLDETYEARMQKTLHRTDDWLSERNVHLSLEDAFVHPPESLKAFGQNFAGHA